MPPAKSGCGFIFSLLLLFLFLFFCLLEGGLGVFIIYLKQDSLTDSTDEEISAKLHFGTDSRGELVTLYSPL